MEEQGEKLTEEKINNKQTNKGHMGNMGTFWAKSYDIRLLKFTFIQLQRDSIYCNAIG